MFKWWASRWVRKLVSIWVSRLADSYKMWGSRCLDGGLAGELDGGLAGELDGGLAGELDGEVAGV